MDRSALSVIKAFVFLLSVNSFAAPAVTRVTGAELKEKLSGAPATVVNFWATWCEPCKEEFPAILKTKKKFEADGVRFLIVSMDGNKQEKGINEFLSKTKVDFETFWRVGNEMEFINSLLPDWSGVIPTTAFFNSQGKLIKMIQAKVDQKSLTLNIKKTKDSNEPAKAEATQPVSETKEEKK